jgi:mannose-6-phosphate isomerase-like protein (cupin superfamily)
LSDHPLRESVDIITAFDRFDDHWSPMTIASMNDYHVKLVKVLGEFVWHRHDDTDELFLVVKGELAIEMEDRDAAILGVNELYVVPKGVLHRPVAESEAWVLLIEPSRVVDTGDGEASDLTTEAVWLDQ